MNFYIFSASLEFYLLCHLLKSSAYKGYFIINFPRLPRWRQCTIIKAVSSGFLKLRIK